MGEANDPGFLAVYLYDREGGGQCVILETLGGPKRYAKVWSSDPSRVEWSWALPDGARPVAP